MNIMFALLPIIPLLLVASGAWLLGVLRNNVGIVDTCWPIFFMIATGIYLWANPAGQSIAWIGLLMVFIWGLRLTIYVSFRNVGHREDRRYTEIRNRVGPGFNWKSLFMIFWFQAVFAWLLSAPLFVIAQSNAPIGILHVGGLTLWIIGFLFETVADWQLLAFQRISGNSDRVLNTGVWRYSRHPNYFGEFCVGWGLYLFALPSGGWWTIFAPLLLTYILLKFSGIARMEAGIDQRRPAYKDYSEKTNAFFPGPPKTSR